MLGGQSDKRLLNIRFFDEKIKKQAYKRQTDKAEQQGISNCPLCASADNANKTKIWALKEMEADHVSAWSKGVKVSLIIAKCFALRIIVQKEINKRVKLIKAVNTAFEIKYQK